MQAAKSLYLNYRFEKGHDMEEQISLSNLIRGYTANVRSLEREISTLQADAEELTREVEDCKEQRESARANLDALRRTQTALMSELDSLRAEFGNAQLDGDVAEEQRIRRRKQEIDAELEEVAKSIRGNVGEPENTDHAQRAAELAVTKSEIEKRLPKKTYEMALNNPMLESISKTLQDDSDRLRKLWNASKYRWHPMKW